MNIFRSVLVSLFAGLPILAQAAEPARPNVVLILVDDLNDWVGCLGGHPQSRTPNIDRLARAGVLFTNAHCAAPACNPSRASILSGLMPWATQVWSNKSRRLLQQHPDQPVLPRVFQQAGYLTLGAGKILHEGGVGNQDLFDRSFHTEQRWSPFTAELVKYTSEELPSKQTANPHHIVRREGLPPVVLPLNRMPSDRNPNKPVGESFDWGPIDVPDSSMGDTRVADWAIEQLKEAHSRPFFLAVGFYRPHIPLWAPKPYFERFEGEEIKLPETLKTDLDDLGKTGVRWAREADTAGLHASVVQYQQWREAVNAYLACITYVDAQIGRVLDALDQSGSRDSTVVILASDHGWHLGEKEHWGKWTGWERSTRVPLIIVPPGDADFGFRSHGKTCEQPVSLVDLFPTLNELCNVKAPGPMDGQSLVPLLRDPTSRTDRTVVTVFDPGNVSLRSDHLRYIRYQDKSEELYDLKEDPHEWTNLAGKPGQGPVLEKFRRQVPTEALPESDRAEFNRLQGGNRKFRARDVFDHSQPILFRSDFRDGSLGKLAISEDDHYGIKAAAPNRLAIVEPPNAPKGTRAVRFDVPPAIGSFRSELALPHEEGFHERWYAARFFIPNDWDDDTGPGADIVMQWHAIPGNWRATYPNLSLDIHRGQWQLRRSFGNAQNGPSRRTIHLAPVDKGVWVHWIVRVRWSPNNTGTIQIWKDEKQVVDQSGPNVYSTIGVEYTPYLKTGIYHPEWKKTDLKSLRSPDAPATGRTVYMTDLVVADERASFELMTKAFDTHR